MITITANILSESRRIQYAANSTIFRSYKVKDLKKVSNKIENEAHAIEQWSQITNMVFLSKSPSPCYFVRNTF